MTLGVNKYQGQSTFLPFFSLPPGRELNSNTLTPIPFVVTKGIERFSVKRYVINGDEK